MLVRALSLYYYQRVLMERIIRAFRSGARDILLHAPPGAGKTLTGKALCAWALRALGGFQGFHTIIISAPLDTIVGPWGEDVSVVFRQEIGALDFCAQRFRHEAGVSPSESWDAFWARTFRSQKKVYCCNRALLTHPESLAALKRVTGNLKGFLLLSDEAHHHVTAKNGREGNKAGEFVDILLKKGGAVLGCSATPYSSGGEVIRESTVVITLPLFEYQRQIDPTTGKPFAPQLWEALPVVVDFKSSDESIAVEQRRRIAEDLDDLTEGDEDTSTTLRQFASEVTEHYVKRWVADGCRKVVMRTRTVSAAKELIALLKRSRKARSVLGHAPRVLDMAGTKTRDEMAEVQAVLREEAKVRRYQDSKVDVIVAVVRMDEGTDWRLCSDVYTTGLPGTMAFNVQLWSRAGRGKGCIEGYPADCENVQRIFYFLPTLDSGAQERLLKSYSDLTIATSLIVQSLEAGLSAINLAVNTSFGDKKAKKKAEPQDADPTDQDVLEADLRDGWTGDLVHSSEQFAKIVKSIKRLEATGAVTVKRVAEVVERASKGLSPLQRTALIQGTMAHLKTGHPDIAEAWACAQRRAGFKVAQGAAVKSGHRAPSFIRAELEGEWRRFVAEHGEKVCPSLERVLEKAASFTGATSEEMVRAWSGSDFPWTEVLILQEAKGYERKIGTRPSAHSGAWDGFKGRSWGAANAWLMTQGSSLARLLGGWHRVVQEKIERILHFHAQHGFWPRQKGTLPDEAVLASALSNYRRMHPDRLSDAGVPLKADSRSRSRR